MLLTLKWMDNLQQIESHQRICHLFYKLTCCTFIDSKENTLTHSFQNYCSKRTKHPPQGFPYGKIRTSHYVRAFGGSPCKPKSLNFPFLLDITPTKKLSFPVPYHRLHFEKKDISNSF